MIINNSMFRVCNINGNYELNLLIISENITNKIEGIAGFNIENEINEIVFFNLILVHYFYSNY